MTATASWVSKTPDRCGGDACVRDTRIPVWSLVEARRLGSTDRQLLDAYPSLQAGDLESAWDYARANPMEIERSIWENQAVMEERAGDHRLALIVRGWQLGLADAVIADAFSPPLASAELHTARQDYQARKDSIDQTLAELLPEELREGLTTDGLAVGG
jgi:uncharacterized protein (DUF433 family)